MYEFKCLRSPIEDLFYSLAPRHLTRVEDITCSLPTKRLLVSSESIRVLYRNQYDGRNRGVPEISGFKEFLARKHTEKSIHDSP
jgi:hypothetical protein